MTQFEELKQLIFKLQQGTDNSNHDAKQESIDDQSASTQTNGSKLLQTLTQTQNILNASIQQVNDITTMRTDILLIYNEIKQDYMNQNKKISDLQQQIDELEQLKDYYSQYQKLKKAVAQNTEYKELEPYFYSSCELLKRMKQIYVVQIKSTTYLSRQFSTFLNTTNQFQQMYNDVVMACKIFETNVIPIYLQEEMSFQSKIQRNTVFEDYDCDTQTNLYNKITIFLNTLPRLVQKRSDAQSPGILMYILGEKEILAREGFGIITIILERVVEMFNVFSSRFIALFKEQYSIKFVQSKEYDKNKQISIVDCSKSFIKYLRMYMVALFEQLDLEHLYYANQQPSSIPGYHYCVQLTENFLTSEYDELLQEENQKKLDNSNTNVGNMASKALKMAQKYYNNTITDYFVKCKVESIRQCFNRHFSTKGNIRDCYFQQKITDVLVQIIYNYLNQIHQQLQWSWEEINQKLNVELVSYIQVKHDIVTDCITQIINLILIQQ